MKKNISFKSYLIFSPFPILLLVVGLQGFSLRIWTDPMYFQYLVRTIPYQQGTNYCQSSLEPLIMTSIIVDWFLLYITTNYWQVDIAYQPSAYSIVSWVSWLDFSSASCARVPVGPKYQEVRILVDQFVPTREDPRMIRCTAACATFGDQSVALWDSLQRTHFLDKELHQTRCLTLRAWPV